MKELSRLCRKLERVTGRRLVVLRFNIPMRKRYCVVELTDTTRCFRVSCDTLADCKRVLLDQFL